MCRIRNVSERDGRQFDRVLYLIERPTLVDLPEYALDLRSVISTVSGIQPHTSVVPNSTTNRSPLNIRTLTTTS